MDATTKITAEEFEKIAGRPPDGKELTRANCHSTGSGHHNCGICPEHNKPRVLCGCIQGGNKTMLPVKLMDDRSRIYPIPEIFPEELGRDWRIYNESDDPRVDMENKVIHAPLANDPISHCLKLQQIGRVKWHEKRDVGDLTQSILFRAIEDARISCLLSKSGIDISAGYLSPDAIVKLGTFIAMAGDTALLSLMLMSDYTTLGEKLAAVYQENKKVIKAFNEAHRRIEADPTVGNSINLANWLRGIFKDMSLPDFDKGVGKQRKKMRGKGGGKSDESEFAECGDLEDYFEAAWDELEQDQMLQQIPAAVRDQLPKDMPAALKELLNNVHPNCSLVPWGEMKVEEPPRTKNIYGKFLRKWKATEEGVLPRYPHRFYLDQKVFARRYKLPGGTVIIDSSGSMHLRPQQIEAIVEHAPGCLVACYSGTGTGGVLRILARNGVRVDEKWCYAPNGTGNIVDFPALKWAYKQAHPRVWVTDYGVTGIHDNPGSANIVMCAAAVKKGRFYVANRVDHAIKVLKGLGRYYRVGR